jgi:GMP synthase (glutamine-hydrolysing)
VLSIALVDASIGDTPAQENVERLTGGRTTAFKAPVGDLPPAPTAPEWDFEAVIVTGSQTSVYEDEPWIHRLHDWIRSVHAAGVPILGICWGHQLLAQALGGRVVDMGEYELGYETVVQVAESRLLEGLPHEFLSFETHSDRVYELPDGARLLAENDVGIQAFEQDGTYGVQFHPEYDLETARRVTERKDLPEERIQAVLEGITESAYESAKPAATVFDNFEAIAAGRVEALSDPG